MVIDIINIISSLATEIIVMAVLTTLIFIKSRLYFIYRVWYYLFSFLCNKKYVLVWMDDTVVNEQALISQLQTDLPNFIIKSILNPMDMLKYPKSCKIVNNIFLVDTDVTKLANTEKDREKLQKHILAYVKNGGILVGTHDIIYRRVRNLLLQAAYGCQITNFVLVDGLLTYKINQNFYTHPLVRDLPHSFEIDDGELCWGDWKAGAQEIASCITDGNEYPVIMVRKYEKGILIWMNTGDQKISQCNAISRLDANFIKLLLNSIIHASEIKSYAYPEC